jgi:hypothetical protein
VGDDNLLTRADGQEAPYMGEDKAYLVRFTQEYMNDPCATSA